jgi:mannose-6-phosphate isomerase-like protein (cupin superfamily)
MFETKQVTTMVDEFAPDGSEVRLLLRRPGGSMAHFRLPAGKTSVAVIHRTVDELWYILAGCGEMWCRCDGTESIVVLQKGVCLSIPAGVAFQFRTVGDEPLEAVAVTMPPWSDNDEAQRVSGCKKWHNV